MTEARAHSPSRSSFGFIARSLASQKTADRRLQLAKTWARIFQYGSLALCRLPARVCANSDIARIEKLGREMAGVIERDPTCAAKYTDYHLWIPFNVARIGALAFQKSPPLRILDIGCGPGYFMAAANACGHDSYGLDAPASIMSDVESTVYSELLAALSCDRRVSPVLIERFVPMPVPLRDLDVITAFWICFNRHRQPDEWGVREWQFFVGDAMSHLRDGGVLHLELNSNPERYHSLQWFDQETLQFFQSVGSVQQGTVRIVKGKQQAWGQNRA
jgi:SAM-dependent methyltransferase